MDKILGLCVYINIHIDEVYKGIKSQGSIKSNLAKM